MNEVPSDPQYLEIASIAVPAVISLIVGAASGWFAAVKQRERLKGEFQLQRDRLRTELKLEFSTEAAIRELLSDPKFQERKRTFTQIKARLGGFSDEELRMHLIRAGAVSFKRKADGAELWGLRKLVGAGELSDDEEGL